jgi:4-diphosphocytidyl-2-C-methyl-D-erythritol kinase
MSGFSVPSYAKINLALYVLGRREDGFHDISSILQLVSLHDTLNFDFAAPAFSFSCEAPGVPADETNLVARAVRLLEKEVGRPLNVAIELAKVIPAGAGLGGGSSNAACTLRTLNEELRLAVPAQRLHELAALLGSDVPFFLTAGQALAEGRGEVLQEISWPLDYHLLIAFPGSPVTAAFGYRRAQITLTNPLGDCRIHRYLAPEKFRGWIRSQRNDLEAGVSSAFPFVREGSEAMRTLGAFHAAMSGSGSAVFGLFSDVVTEETRLSWPTAGPWHVWIVQPIRTSGLPMPASGGA